MKLVYVNLVCLFTHPAPPPPGFAAAVLGWLQALLTLRLPSPSSQCGAAHPTPSTVSGHSRSYKAAPVLRPSDRKAHNVLTRTQLDIPWHIAPSWGAAFPSERRLFRGLCPRKGGGKESAQVIYTSLWGRCKACGARVKLEGPAFTHGLCRACWREQRRRLIRSGWLRTAHLPPYHLK